MVSEDSEYDRLYNAICSIVAILKDEGIDIQTKFEKDSGYVGLYTSDAPILKRAKISLKELLELSYSTAEHHPFWNLLYNTSEIAKTILDYWDENFSHDQIKEMIWRNEEIKNVLNRLEKEYQL